MGQFKWRFTPFGLKGAPSTFQAIVSSIFFDILGQAVWVYMDDVLMYTATFEEHLRLLDSVLARLLQHKMYPKLAKCKYGAQSIEHLGYRVGARTAWKRPLQLKQKACFQWTAAHSSAVQALKVRLIHYTKLSLPELTEPFILRTDASGVAIGAVLEQDGKPLDFLGKLLSNAEMRYSTYDQELLEIVRAIERWRHFLIATEVTVYTDHQALQFLTKLRFDRRIRLPVGETHLHVVGRVSVVGGVGHGVRVVCDGKDAAAQDARLEMGDVGSRLNRGAPWSAE
ncbi:hypothetical protein Esti_005835 [Eimeria stiedai]